MGIDTSRFRGGQKKEWADWLSDDPIEPVVRPRVHTPASRTVSEPVKARASTDTKAQQKTVAINITVPKVDLRRLVSRLRLQAFLSRLRTKRVMLIAGVSCAVLIAGGIALTLTAHHPKGTTGVLGEVSQTPDYKYILPSGAADKKVAYNAQRKVVSFTDTVGGVAVTVSQQPLPESFKKDPDDATKKLAEGFSATDVISTSTPTAYLGTSVKGPQTVIFHKGDVLVFIQSVSNIDKHDWAEYITKLE